MSDSVREEPASPQARLTGAILSFATGLGIVALAAGWIPMSEESVHAPRWVIGACGAVFIMAGAMIVAPENAVRWRNFMSAVFMTVFAAIPGWIAFGPGERQFSGSLSVGAVTQFTQPDVSTGRIVFGAGAVLIGVWAAYAWYSWLRSLFKARDGAQ